MPREWRHTRIGDSRGEEHGRIAGAVLDRLVAVDGLECAVAGLGRDRAPLGLLTVTVLFRHVTQGIRPADAVDHGGEQIRTFGHGAPDRDAAGRAAADCQMFARRVALRAELLAHGDQVAPGIGLVGELAGLVPFAPVLTAAAHVGVADDGARVDERQNARIERRTVSGDAVGAVGRDPNGVAAIELEPLAMDQRVGNLGSVMRSREHPRRLVRAHIDAGPRRDAGIGHTAVRRHRPNAAGREPAGQRDQRAILGVVGEHGTDGPVERQRDLGHAAAAIEPAQPMNAAVHDAQVEAVERAGHVLDDRRALRNHFRCGAKIRR